MKNRIQLVHGDITEMTCDVIVNAANKYLVPGGGVDGAIHSAGGAAILAGCRNYISRFGELETGQAMITESGRLSSEAVIHTVGPKILSDLTKECCHSHLYSLMSMV
jgi:O-acetyl-ADP-ribose deacetylase (regulator of RNase III)